MQETGCSWRSFLETGLRAALPADRGGLRPMKKSEFILLAVILGYVLAAGAQDPQKQPKLEHFDPNQADRSLDPCQDFYKFACNKWFAANPIPADEMYWTTGSTLGLWSESVLRETMERVSVDSPGRTPVYQKVG